METFAIAAFRSRQAVFRFESKLRSLGIPSVIISTPKAVSLGCGLSLRFDQGRLSAAITAYDEDPVPNLIGFYTVYSDHNGMHVSPARKS